MELKIGNAVMDSDERVKVESPEILLWSEVMLMALDDLRNGDGQATRAAECWFQSPATVVGSFLWVCDALNLDPGDVRQNVQCHNLPFPVGMFKDQQ